MGWIIKQKPEDFVVHEIIDDKIRKKWHDKLNEIHNRHRKGLKESTKRTDEYLWFTLCKNNISFFEAIDRIAGNLGISTKQISYSGTKDKRAVTYQTISVTGIKKEEIKRLKIRGMAFSDFRYKDRHLKLGDYIRNGFKITVRNINKDQKEKEKIIESIERMGKEGFINLFGQQRFGLAKNNHIIGKMILSGKADKAIKIFMEKDIQLMKLDQKYERILSSYLNKDENKNDFTGAIRRLPLRLAKLFIHAFQAHIWNMTALEYSELSESFKSPKKSHAQFTIPIPGYRTILSKYPETEKIIHKMLKNEGIRLSDFRLGDIPELSSKGTERDFIAFPRHLCHEWGNDELNKGKLKLILEYELDKGSYATELVRQLEERRN